MPEPHPADTCDRRECHLHLDAEERTHPLPANDHRMEER